MLSAIVSQNDLDQAITNALMSGVLTADEAHTAKTLLEERITQVANKGWFTEDRDKVLNEVNIIDSDGQLLRPDRVVKDGDKVMIIDYKFGEHYRKYETQMKKYVDVWKRMGYADVSACLWYVHTGEILQIV